MELLLILLILVGTEKEVLSLLPILKQQCNELINEKSQTNIKNRTYYFYNGIIIIEEFNSSLLKRENIAQRYWYLLYWIYHNLKNWWQCKPFVSEIGKLDGHIEENNGNKYLVFDSTDETKKY